jgi:hypothetical protein
MKTISFSAMWSDRLGEAIKARSSKPYPMEFHQGTEDFQSLMRAVNQGIDAYLEAVQFSEFNGAHGRRGFTITPDTLHVLIRRLMESENENDNSLASGICSTLEIELI